MHVVVVSPDLKKMYVVALGDLKADLAKSEVDWFSEHHFPVFRRTDQVVHEKCDIVTFVYMGAHLTSLAFSKQSFGELDPEGIKLCFRRQSENRREGKGR